MSCRAFCILIGLVDFAVNSQPLQINRSVESEFILSYWRLIFLHILSLGEGGRELTHWVHCRKTEIIRSSGSQDRGIQLSIMDVRGPMIVSMKIQCFITSWKHEEVPQSTLIELRQHACKYISFHSAGMTGNF